MTLTKIFPLVVAALYAATAIAHLRRGEVAAAGLWASYAIGNCFIVSVTH